MKNEKSVKVDKYRFYRRFNDRRKTGKYEEFLWEINWKFKEGKMFKV